MRSMRRLFAWVSPCLLFVGCASIEDCHYSFVNEYRANVAWYATDYDKHDVRCFSDFGYGWRMGYYDASMGRCGRTPAIPPKKYWKASYQAGDGPAAINAWYQGYQAGAIAADRDGYGSLHTLPAFGANVHSSLPSLPYSEQGVEPGVPTAPASPAASPEEVSPPSPPPAIEEAPGSVQGASWTSVYSGGVVDTRRRRLPLTAAVGGSAPVNSPANVQGSATAEGEAPASSSLEPLPPTTLADLPSQTTVVR